MNRGLRTGAVAVLIVAVLLSALVTGATFSPSEAEPTLSLMLTGTADLDGEAGFRSLSSGEYGLVEGDEVRLTSGEAVLALADGGSVELRAGSGESPGTRLVASAIPELLAGDALLEAGPITQSVDAGGARLSLTGGAVHLGRATGATFAVYSGQAELTSVGRTLEGGLPALRQVSVPDAGLLPLAPTPLRVAEPPDPWDRRFLAAIIALDEVLERRALGFSALLDNDVSPNVFFFQAVLPGLLQEPAFDQALLEGGDRPVGETLVGASIALVGDRGGFSQRWSEVFEMRRDGAGWGIIAADQGADRPSLLFVLEQAAERFPLLFRAPSPIPVFQPVVPPTPSPGTRPGVTPPQPLAPPVTGPAPPPVVPAPPPGAPPVLVPGAPDDDGLLGPVVDPLVDLLDGVLDGLGGLTRGLL